MDWSLLIALVSKLAPEVIQAIINALSSHKAGAAELPPEAKAILQHVVDVHQAAAAAKSAQPK